jgi:hypothetical protein
MEITSFVLGMLTVTGLAIAVLVVLGIVKIYKQKEQMQNLQDHIDNVQRNLDESFMKCDDQRCRNTDEIYREFETIKRELVSYVDSRIDKLQTKKEVLKG